MIRPFLVTCNNLQHFGVRYNTLEYYTAFWGITMQHITVSEVMRLLLSNQGTSEDDNAFAS